jgi:uncharacterized protein (TIGR02145 family)
MRTHIVLFLFILLSATNAFSQNSNIQVVAEPDISIFLDGQFKGKTNSEMGGLIIENINAGQYTIKAVKEGFIPKEEIINVKWGEVLRYTVNPSFVPSIKISQKGNDNSQQLELKTGKLKIQSLPIEINIEIQLLGIKDFKNQDEWIAESIPEGTYGAVFSWNNKTLKYNFDIKQDQEAYFFVNMISGKIENRGKGFTNNESGTFTDFRDNKTYKLVKIGTQTWMAENLNFYSNGGSWANSEKYGRLYNWKTATTACPSGWHLPSREEFQTLIDYVGGKDNAYKALSPEGNSGFSYLLAGFRDPINGKIYNTELTCFFWTSTSGIYLHIRGGIEFGGNMKADGHSVRCIKDY